METDPLNLGPSNTVNCLAADEPINNSNETGSLRHAWKGGLHSPFLPDFICFVCNNEFDDMAKLHVHMSMKHKGIKPYRCEYCAKAFATTKSVCVHLQLHHFGRDDKYLCLQCKTYFHRSYELVDHNAIVHKKNHPCGTCCKCFTQIGELTLHERMHSFDKSFHCQQCNETFMSPSSLSVHVHRVHEFNIGRQVHCPLCDYSFSKQSELNAHIYVHGDDAMPFECPDCAELFDGLELFIEHMVLHEKKSEVAVKELTQNANNDISEPVDSPDESNDFMDNSAVDDTYDDPSDDIENNLTKMGVILSYTCPICQKLYEDITEFNAHCETHETQTEASHSEKPQPKPPEGMLKPNRPRTTRTAVSLKWQENDNKVRNFSCEKCNRSFTMASTLSLHLRRTHLGIKPYKCQVCEWAFAQSSDLIKHMRKHTGEKPYSCSTCGARFSQNRNLRNHMKIHTDEPSICKYCDKKFLIDTSLIQHLKKHEGPNVINCTVCQIPFSTQISWTNMLNVA